MPARLYWVLTGAIAAAVLRRITGDRAFSTWLQRWWDYAATTSSTNAAAAGTMSWVANQPATGMRSGKPDVYHAYQTVLVAQLSQRRA